MCDFFCVEFASVVGKHCKKKVARFWVAKERVVRENVATSC